MKKPFLVINLATNSIANQCEQQEQADYLARMHTEKKQQTHIVAEIKKGYQVKIDSEELPIEEIQGS